MQKQGILALLRRQPELALRMLGSMSSHLRVLVGQLEDMTLKDVETRLAPTINTGIAHREPGVGQVGAGIVKAPLRCFEEALVA